MANVHTQRRRDEKGEKREWKEVGKGENDKSGEKSDMEQGPPPLRLIKKKESNEHELKEQGGYPIKKNIEYCRY